MPHARPSPAGPGFAARSPSPGRGPAAPRNWPCPQHTDSHRQSAGALVSGRVRQACFMNVPFPEPTTPVPARAEVFLGYLDFFRSRLVSKLEALPAGELRRSQLPSGWTPIELLKHLAYVELRWLEWGFEGRDVPDRWADSRDGRWYVAACSRSTPATSATSTSSA